jgi:UDP-2,4-diacetamido-2,4,6-trideoxy-beta-L-altropyranose hydrolase
MKFSIRTDASVQIGIGHVMRCLTLAEALRRIGAECCFISRDHPGNMIGMIRQRGFSVSVLPKPAEAVGEVEQRVEAQSIYETWLGADWRIDAAQTIEVIGATKIDWLIVDHYAIDSRWENTMRPMCRKLMVIDDLADRAHDCDLLLDQNLGRDCKAYDGLVPKEANVLSGPRYALLRPDFANLREYSSRRRATPKFQQIMISMGGVDQFDATGQVLEVLSKCSLPESAHITIVMGLYAPWLERVKLLAQLMPRPTKVKVNVNDMAQLMADSDLAIGAAGSTSWERCCLGLPAFVVVLAANQRDAAIALEQTGSVKLLGSIDDIPSTLPSIFNQYQMTEIIEKLSKSCWQVTDGKGVGRVIKELGNCYG